MSGTGVGGCAARMRVGGQRTMTSVRQNIWSSVMTSSRWAESKTIGSSSVRTTMNFMLSRSSRTTFFMWASVGNQASKSEIFLTLA